MAKSQTRNADESSGNVAADLEEFLESSCSVGVWEVTESGTPVIREAMRLDPTEIPDGWEIDHVSGRSVFLEESGEESEPVGEITGDVISEGKSVEEILAEYEARTEEI